MERLVSEMKVTKGISCSRFGCDRPYNFALGAVLYEFANCKYFQMPPIIELTSRQEKDAPVEQLLKQLS